MCIGGLSTPCHGRRYYAPERDIKLVHSINPYPETWAEFLMTSGFDGSQSLDDIRDKFGH